MMLRVRGRVHRCALFESRIDDSLDQGAGHPGSDRNQQIEPEASERADVEGRSATNSICLRGTVIV
jgi:hypothetical protein